MEKVEIENNGLGEEGAVELNAQSEDNANKPSEEEVQAAEKEFQEAIDDWNLRTWKIEGDGTVEGTMSTSGIISYLQNFLQGRAAWVKDQWMGMIKMSEALAVAELSGIISFEYPALEFSYFMLTNPGGIGLESAKEFESEQEQYAYVMSLISEQLQAARERMEEIKFLQDKWSGMAQGFYYEKDGVKPSQDDNIPEGAYWDNELQKYVKPGDPDYSVDIYNELVSKKLEEEKQV